MKLKAFQFIDILYIQGDKLCIAGTKGQYDEFDLKTVLIMWADMQIQNGVMKWFSITAPSGQNIYINAEIGIFVFRISKKLPSTREIFLHLIDEQSKLKDQGTQN